MKANYAIKPTPEQALRTNRTMSPARLIAALELKYGGFVGIAQAVKQKVCRRIDELISQGQAIPAQTYQKAVSWNMLSEDVQYKTVASSKWSEFIEWRTSCTAVLDQAVPKSSLLRKTVDDFGSLQNSPEKVEFGCAFLRSVRKELEEGSLEALADQIESELVADYLTQAEEIFSESEDGLTHVASAVLAGASLEHFLKRMCERLEPPEPISGKNGAPLAMNGLIEALKARGSFNEVEAKLLRAWAGIRNAAAHGEFGTFTRDQVGQMISGVLSFVGRYGG